MTKDINLAKNVGELYRTELGAGEVAFIYLGNAGILLRTKELAIAFDPADFLSKVTPAIASLDFITYSHSHYDHYTLAGAVSLFKNTNARIISEFSMVEELKSKIPHDMIISGPQSFRTPDDELVVKSTGAQFKMHRGVHPRQIIQFRVTIGRLRIFHCADSGYWDIGKKRVDVAFIPTGSPSPTCAPGVGLAVVMDMQPKYAVAVHGSEQQRRKFKALVESELPSTAIILPRRNQLTKLSIN